MAFAVALCLLIGTGVVVARRLVVLARALGETEAALSAEIETQHRRTSLLEANQRGVADHLGEVREILNLSRGSYRFAEDANLDETTAVGPDPASVLVAPAADHDPALFVHAIDRIAAERRIQEFEVELSHLLPAHFEGIAGDHGLAFRSAGRLRWIAEEHGTVPAERRTWLRVFVTPQAVTLLSLTGERRETPVSPDITAAIRDAADHAVSFLDSAERAIVRFEHTVLEVEETLQDAAISQSLSEAGLELSEPSRSPATYRRTIVERESGRIAFSLSVDVDGDGVSLDDGEPLDASSLTMILAERIHAFENAEIGTPEVAVSLDLMRALAADSAFDAFLKGRGLRLSNTFRDTQDFLYFDVRTTGGDLFGSFAVLKHEGTIYLADSDDIIITTLTNAARDPIQAIEAAIDAFAHDNTRGRSRNLPTDYPPGFVAAGDVDGTNIVLLGIHENRADAIILIHLDPNRTISMIGIPRDIWWNERKLGHYNEVYGNGRLVEEIEALIDIEIDGYVAIDMYAFVDVVDILGGITIELTEPLVDPTYVVREAGRWGTLYYEAGEHHLGGIAALRLARSRHSSNDFERALRQQQILGALRSRLNELDAGDLNEVYRIVNTVFGYLETSFSSWELAQFYLAYREADIVNRTGITFDNVLYPTWSNLYYRGLQRDQVPDDFYLGAWILLPRGDDWNVIPWFVRENLR